jgi:uncharacterized SAM-binding protein YcdF (DUF218 family)
MWEKKLFKEMGLDTARITFERNSRNTFENAVLSKELVNPKSGDQWILITTAWHMPRSLGVFCKAGWPVIPYPVDHWTMPGNLLRVDLDLSGHLREFTFGMKEWLGLLVYYLSGKTTAVFPDACGQVFDEKNFHT